MRIHTFKLFTPITGYEKRQLASYFFSIARNLKRCSYQTGDIIFCNYWKNEGVILSLKETPIGASLHMRINPNDMLENYDPLATFLPGEENTICLIEKLQRIINELPLPISASDLRLYRADLCKDNIMPESACLEYIRLLRRRQIPQNWKRATFDDERDLHSFRAGNARYQVTAYDKLYQLSDCKNVNASQRTEASILRIEVALLRNGLLHLCKTGEYGLRVDCGWTEQLCLLSKSSESIMLKCFDKIASGAPYCTLAQAKEFIEHSSLYQNKKQNLIVFITTINYGKAVDLPCLKKNKSAKKRLEQLAQLGINPVTIDARAGWDVLPSLQQLIRNVVFWTDSPQDLVDVCGRF